MKKIKLISAKNSFKNTGKLKVAAYCRVSTNRESQQSSIDLQIRYYTELTSNESRMEFRRSVFMKAGLENRSEWVWIQ